MSVKHPNRGFTMMEVLVAMGISAMLLGLIYGVVISGARSFSREQTQTFTQFRARTSLDDIAKDIRSAVEVATPAVPSGVTRAVAVNVPRRDASGILYSDPSNPTADTMLKNCITYYVQGSTLYRRIEPVGGTRGTPVAIAQNVSALSVTMRTAAGAATTDVTQAAVVDVSATIGSTSGTNASTVAFTGVRLRNKLAPAP